MQWKLTWIKTLKRLLGGISRAFPLSEGKRAVNLWVWSDSTYPAMCTESLFCQKQVQAYNETSKVLTINFPKQVELPTCNLVYSFPLLI